MSNNLFKAFNAGWDPYFHGEIHEWIERFVSLPSTYSIPGKVRFDRSKYLIPPLLALRNPHIRQVNCMAAVQCFAKGTKVLLYNEPSTKNIEELKIGDVVVGDDGNPRKVIDTHYGTDELFKIIPHGSYAEPYVVSRNHIMCLKKYHKNKRYYTIDIPLLDYLEERKKQKRRYYFGYKGVAEWEEQPVSLEPYFMGVWLGDGTSSLPHVTNMEPEIEKYLFDYANRLGMVCIKYPAHSKASLYKFVKANKNNRPNKVMDLLRGYNVINNKHIPKAFLQTSRKNRLELLAGLIDTDGYRPIRENSKNTCELVFSNERLARDIVYLCRSLGFRTSISKKKTTSQNGYNGVAYRLMLYGELHLIPTKVIRKQWQQTELYNVPSNYGFKVEPVGIGEFFGICVDGNDRFLLEDFTVVHNTGKSFMMECWIAYLLANDSGTLLRLAQSDEFAKRMNETRLMPLLQLCNPVNAMLRKDKHSFKKQELLLPHFHVFINGQKPSALQSVAAKYLIADECFMYDEGHLLQAKGRTKAFANTSKILFISQAGIENCEWTREFNNGIVYEYAWTCPKCKKEQVFNWNKKTDTGYAGVIWDKNEKTCKDGVWNYLEAGKTARLRCEHCNHEVNDDPQSRRYLNDTSTYICTKPNGDPSIVSYRWASIANIDISFSSLVIRYLQAKDALSLEGNLIPLQEFYQKDLAKPWDTNVTTNVSKILTEDYNPLDTWGDYKFMTVDVQASNLLYWLIRAWNKAGESRLVKWGKALSFDEIASIQKEHSVRDQNVFIDSGYNSTLVYAACVNHYHIGTIGGRKMFLSWQALKGYDALDFLHADGSRKLYSPVAKGDPNLGKDGKGRMCPLYRFSNYSLKNILAHLRDGKGVKWIVNEVDAVYEAQMNSEVLQRTIDKKTNREKWIWVKKSAHGDNHIWDLEVMQCAAACMANLLGNVDKVRTTTLNTEGL